jgi:hypothetical protein
MPLERGRAGYCCAMQVLLDAFPVAGSNTRPLRRLPPACLCGPGSRPGPPLHGQVAQLVEQRTENPRVGGSIPPLATIIQ